MINYFLFWRIRLFEEAFSARIGVLQRPQICCFCSGQRCIIIPYCCTVSCKDSLLTNKSIREVTLTSKKSINFCSIYSPLWYWFRPLFGLYFWPHEGGGRFDISCHSWAGKSNKSSLYALPEGCSGRSNNGTENISGFPKFSVKILRDLFFLRKGKKDSLRRGKEEESLKTSLRFPSPFFSFATRGGEGEWRHKGE